MKFKNEADLLYKLRDEELILQNVSLD